MASREKSRAGAAPAGWLIFKGVINRFTHEKYNHNENGYSAYAEHNR